MRNLWHCALLVERPINKQEESEMARTVRRTPRGGTVDRDFAAFAPGTLVADKAVARKARRAADTAAVAEGVEEALVGA